MSNTLLGGAIGDALGMPFERKLINDPLLMEWSGENFLASESHQLKPGQWTDDSAMQQIVAESLIQQSTFNPQDLASRYMNWFFSPQSKGAGRTTRLAMENLKAGKSWEHSGIVGSIGNGTAMRAAPFGVFYRHDIPMLIQSVKIDNSITHASEEAEAGALAIALTAAYAANNDIEDLLKKIIRFLPDTQVKKSIFSLDAMVHSEHITAEQALRLIGTKFDVRETVPAALYCFMKFKDYHSAVVAAIKAGGDTDTTAAIVGALFGAKDGLQGIKAHLISQVEKSDYLIQLDSQLYNRSNTNYFPLKQ
jgi:ADP-ribosyl-[dinitrogen reductase] hydrolase